MVNYFNNIDQNLFLWMNGFHDPLLDPLMIFLSGQSIWIPMVAFFLWRAKKVLSSKQLGVFCLFLLMVLILSDVTSSYIAKNIFGRIRPCRLQELKSVIYQFGQKCGGKYGFASSHAANSTALVFFSLNALELKTRYHLVWILVLLVCLSRIYLGVHYPGDIVGGCTIGSLWAGLITFLFRRTTGHV